MLSRNRKLLSAMGVMLCVELLAAWDVGAQGYFYAIGHMTNTRSAVDWAVSTGAIALKADLNLDDAGDPTLFRHGFPCDCTCFTGGVYDRLDSCGASTNASALLQHIATKPIALLVIDSKVDGSTNPQRAVTSSVCWRRASLRSGIRRRGHYRRTEAEHVSLPAVGGGGSAGFPSMHGESISPSTGRGTMSAACSGSSSLSRRRTSSTAPVPPPVLRGRSKPPSDRRGKKGAGVIGLDYIWTLDREPRWRGTSSRARRGSSPTTPIGSWTCSAAGRSPLAAPGTAIPPATTPTSLRKRPPVSCLPSGRLPDRQRRARWPCLRLHPPRLSWHRRRL